MPHKQHGDDSEQDTPSCVLVVDDEDSINEEIVDWLALSGISTRSAPGAEGALAILAHDPDVTVLLTDLHMPRLGGLALSRAARAARSEEFAFEVVVLTGHATVAHALDAGKAGVIDFLDKPVQLTRLREALDKAHRAASGRRRAFRRLAGQRRALDTATDLLAAALDALPSAAAATRPAPGVPAACAEVLTLLRLVARSAGPDAPGGDAPPQAPLLDAACRLAGYALALLQGTAPEPPPGVARPPAGDAAADAASPAAPDGSVPPPVALHLLLERVIAGRRSLAATRAQQLRVECPPGLRIRTDPAGLDGLLGHLLAVTIQAAPPGSLIRLVAGRTAGGVRLAVRAEATARACDTACTEACAACAEALHGGADSLATTLAARVGGRLGTCPPPGQGHVVTLCVPACPPSGGLAA